MNDLLENPRAMILASMLLFLGAILVFNYFFNTRNTILKQLKKTPSKSPNAIKENEYVFVKGKAKAIGEPLIAPLSGKKCLLYEIVVEEKRKSWVSIYNDTILQDFYIDSHGEKVRVDTRLPRKFRRVFLDKDTSGGSSVWKKPNHKLTAYLKTKGTDSKNFLGIQRKLRYKEGILEIDENVAIKGIANWKTLSQPIEGFNYSKIVTLTGSKKQKLLITDTKKAFENKLR